MGYVAAILIGVLACAEESPRTEPSPEPIASILEEMVLQKQRFRPEGLHALGVEGLAALLDELLPDTAKPKPVNVPPEYIDKLVAQLGDPNFRARETAFSELVKLGAGAKPFLMAATQHEDPEISWRAYRILRRWEWQKFEDKSRFVEGFSVYVSGIRDAARLRELASRVVAAMQSGPPRGGRHQILTLAMRAVASANNDELTNLLAPLLAHRDAQVATMVVHTVASTTSRTVCPQLFLDALSSPRSEVVTAAINYVPNCREHARAGQVQKLLVGILEGQHDTLLKLQVCGPLWHAFQYGPALDFLLEQVKAVDKNLRYQALNRLMYPFGRGRQAAPKFVQAMEPLLKDEDENTRRMAMLAVSSFEGEAVVRAVVPLLADRSESIAKEVPNRLRQQADKDMLRRVLAAAAHEAEKPELRKAAAALLEDLKAP